MGSPYVQVFKTPPEATPMKGGIDRLVACMEQCRDKDDQGYGSGRVQQIKDWPGTSKVTSCSPFTATIIGMIFDQSGSSSLDVYEPKFDNKSKPLPRLFYAYHQVDDRQVDSCIHYNLGYEIAPEDMRRGDLLEMNFLDGGGHAAICWDVHLDANGVVDCFTYASSNGFQTGHPGVSVGCTALNQITDVFLDHSGNTYKKKAKFTPLFKDYPEYIQWGDWQALVGVSKADIDLDTFKDPGPRWINTAPIKYALKSVRVLRFWGIAPPATPHGDATFQAKFAKATELKESDPPDSYATGKRTTKPHVEKAPATTVKGSDKAKDPDAASKVQPKKVDQKKDVPVDHQHDVEHALKALYKAGWIAKDPGDSDNLNDAQTQAAISDFQEKFHIQPVCGIAGPKTRPALREQLGRCQRGEPNPNASAPKKDEPPTVDHLYWLKNRCQPGDFNMLGLVGKNLGLVQTFDVTLKEQKSGKTEKLLLPLVASFKEGLGALTLPQSFGMGSVIVAHVEADTPSGKISKDSDHPLVIGPPVPPPPPKAAATPAATDGSWPWDDSKWPQRMRDRLADLRATQAPTGGTFDRRQITHYYVKVAKAGNTPVVDASGNQIGTCDWKTLFEADIEGTLRLADGRVLNIDDSHGTVYGPKQVPGRDGKIVTKNKPISFDPMKSHWKDVTATTPWGSGAGGQGGLIPFRTLAHNPHERLGGATLYGKKVYIKQLDGHVLPTGETHNGICYVGDCGGMVAYQQFDFFTGTREYSGSLGIPDTCDVQILS